MFEIDRPFPIKGLPFKPEMTGRPKVDEKLIMTLATLLGWDGESRRLLNCGVGGALQTIAPIAKGIVNVLGSGANDDITFADEVTSEVMLLANAANGGDIWINIGASAAVDTGWPLDAGDIVIMSVNNMQELQARIIADGDKLIILKTV